ncbi:hypothetical protein CYLTODRAFT_454194 [Cylindrobasidium torrendii FP15055 ss-10]|uniref:Uncharacterized protein n=1 Tax=Cylindrobasidium torrendii FP15055 ss-10 TaxID=1314674 RepID=A0A0D7BB64_9AGAR|nr:hypothetical protein CYLTODRAFT_454194 [Cylindrobasidium torrendii FP15055 ss-10]
MRHSFIVPNHIGFNLDIPAWMKLRAAADDALRWVTAHPSVLDAPFMVSYAIILCALIQYHTWARRKEVEGITALQQLQTAIDGWSQALPDDFLSLKRSEYAVIQVFLDAVEKVHQPGYSSFESKRGLSPTVGVQNRLPTSTVGFALLSDGTSSSGGILVITAEKAKEIKDLPPGTVIIGTQGEGLGAVVQVVGQPSSTVELETLLSPQHEMLHPYSVDSAMFSDSFSFPQDMQMQILEGSQEQGLSGFF